MLLWGDFDNDAEVAKLLINLHENPSLLQNDIRGKQSGIKVKT